MIDLMYVLTAVNGFLAVLVTIGLVVCRRERKRTEDAKAIITRSFADLDRCKAVTVYNATETGPKIAAKARMSAMLSIARVVLEGGEIAGERPESPQATSARFHAIVRRCIGNRHPNAMTEADARLIMEACIRHAAEQLDIPSFAAIDGEDAP